MNIPKYLSKRIINSYCTQLMTSIISMRHVVQHWRVSNSGYLYWNTLEYLFAGSKTKERISKRVFQGNKVRQIVRKTNKNVRFLENLACFVFLKHPFWDSLLLSTYWSNTCIAMVFQRHVMVQLNCLCTSWKYSI